jgi:hypothetical protein
MYVSQIPTTTNPNSQNENENKIKQKSPGDESSQNRSRKNPATFEYESEKMEVDTTPKIAQYHHRSLGSGPKAIAGSSARDVTPSTHRSGDCEIVSVYAK